MRRLEEIAVLRRRDDGMVAAVTAWHADHGFDDGMAHLAELLRTRARP